MPSAMFAEEGIRILTYANVGMVLWSVLKILRNANHKILYELELTKWLCLGLGQKQKINL